MSTPEILLAAYSSQFLSTVLFYPWRDLMNLPGRLEWRRPKDLHASTPRNTATDPTFYTRRWKGMIRNPQQPALIALFPTALYYCVISGSSVTPEHTTALVAWLVTGTVTHAIGTTALPILSHRMADTDHKGRFMYGSLSHCITQSTARLGYCSWLSGLSFQVPISFLAHTVPLYLLCASENAKGRVKTQKRQRRGSNVWCTTACFLKDWCTGTLYNVYGVLGATLFRVMRNSTTRGQYNVILPLPGHWVRYEAQAWREATRTFQSCCHRDGVISYLVQPGGPNSVLRVMSKTSLPFGFSWAVYRTLGGPTSVW